MILQRGESRKLEASMLKVSDLVRPRIATARALGLFDVYGIITDIINLPTNNSLIFSYEGKEIMIPISNDFIELFDFENKVVIVKNSDVFINKC